MVIRDRHELRVGDLVLFDWLAGVARLIVVETAGRAAYAPTRAFYEARGYRAVSRIPDFYAPGDDQVVYVKALGSTSGPDGRA